MSEDYWEKKYKEKEAQENFNDQMNGCLALFLIAVAIGLAVFLW